MLIAAGISPGTRFIGIAIFKDGMLLDCRTKTFPGKWTAKKCRTILNVLDTIFLENRVTAVAVKVPDANSHLKHFDTVLGCINVICERNSIIPKYYTLSQLKRKHSKTEVVNKKVLLASIALQYPELQALYHKSQRNKSKYFERMFEAVLVGRHSSN